MATSTKISFPALAISQGNSVYQWSQLHAEYATNAYALARGYWDHLTLYDSAALAWSVAAVTPSPPLSRFGRLLARTVYNPKRMVRLTFHEPRSYRLTELKDQLLDLVNRDDDILTQFIDREDLERLIHDAASFGRLLADLTEHGVIAER